MRCAACEARFVYETGWTPPGERMFRSFKARQVFVDEGGQFFPVNGLKVHNL